MARIYIKKQIIADGSSSTTFKVDTVLLTNRSKIKIKVAPYGGFVIKVKELEK
jgi:hypothetical protein